MTKPLTMNEIRFLKSARNQPMQPWQVAGALATYLSSVARLCGAVGRELDHRAWCEVATAIDRAAAQLRKLS